MKFRRQIIEHIVYGLYVFDGLSLTFHITYLASLASVFVVVDFHYLCIDKFTLD